jgi:hypothetical protein
VNKLKQPEKQLADNAGAPWQSRSSKERRSRSDKRTSDSHQYLQAGGVERRKKIDRRQSEERRDKWLRVDRWRSVAVFDEE